jgi:thymidylate kinase
MKKFFITLFRDDDFGLGFHAHMMIEAADEGIAIRQAMEIYANQKGLRVGMDKPKPVGYHILDCTPSFSREELIEQLEKIMKAERATEQKKREVEKREKDLAEKDMREMEAIEKNRKLKERHLQIDKKVEVETDLSSEAGGGYEDQEIE